MKISPRPSQILILGKKGGGHPKLGKNSTNSDLAQNFRVTSDQQKIVIRGENLSPPLSQNLILAKNWGGMDFSPLMSSFDSYKLKFQVWKKSVMFELRYDEISWARYDDLLLLLFIIYYLFTERWTYRLA